MKLTFEDIREHNISLKVNKTSKFNPTDVTDSIQENMGEFAKELADARNGNLVDKKGNRIKPLDVPFHKAVEVKFGCDIKTFMKQIGVFSGSDTLHDAAVRFGAPSLNKAALEGLLLSGGGIGFGSTGSTKDIASDFRFIIPELILTAIRLGYEHTAQHLAWIAMTQQMGSSVKATMPRILRGDGIPTRVNEGANIPVGSVKFGKKQVGVFKVGTGFSITDELVDQSSIDMLFTFLQEVGNDMSIGADVEAMRVLISGEQADGSESAPVVGTVNGTSFAYNDIKRVTTRMKRLKHNVSRLITSEDDGIAITGLDRFEGFNGPTKLATINSIIGVPDTLENDVQILPSGQVMFLGPERTMAKLSYKSMMMERERNVQNQTEQMFVSDWIGFAIIRRDGRVLLDKTQTYGSVPFPAYMNIDARIAEGFNNF